MHNVRTTILTILLIIGLTSAENNKLAGNLIADRVKVRYQAITQSVRQILAD